VQWSVAPQRGAECSGVKIDLPVELYIFLFFYFSKRASLFSLKYNFSKRLLIKSTTVIILRFVLFFIGWQSTSYPIWRIDNDVFWIIVKIWSVFHHNSRHRLYYIKLFLKQQIFSENKNYRVLLIKKCFTFESLQFLISYYFLYRNVL